VASLTVEDARTIKASPWDTSLVQAIDKAISQSDLGVSASVSEGVVRIHFPELTGETREKIVRLAKDKYEEARIALRNERNRVMSELEKSQKAGEMGEDDLALAKQKVEAKIADANKELDTLLEKKRSEVLG
jgi:ribosome recycling factor